MKIHRSINRSIDQFISFSLFITISICSYLSISICSYISISIYFRAVETQWRIDLSAALWQLSERIRAQLEQYYLLRD